MGVLEDMRGEGWMQLILPSLNKPDQISYTRLNCASVRFRGAFSGVANTTIRIHYR